MLRASFSRARRAVVLFAPLPIALAPAAAQQASRPSAATATLDVSAASVAYDAFARSTVLSLTPTIRLDGDVSSATLTGTLSSFESGTWTAQGSASGSVFSPAAFGWLRGELLGSAGGSAHQDLTRSGQFLAGGRAHVFGAARGVWAGAAAGRAWNDFVWRDLRQGDLGAWVRADATTLVATLAPTSVGDSVRYTDAEFGGRWLAPRLELSVVAGSRFGTRGVAATAWGSVTVTSWLGDVAALVASAGSYAADPTQALPGGTYASLGLRLATRPAVPHGMSEAMRRHALERLDRPAAARLTVRHIGPGRIALEVLAPGAQRVEVMGDFTNWDVVPMARAGAGRWTLTADAAPGLRRMNVRIDGGAWDAPPGVTAITDDFGGVVGVIQVPDR